MLLITHHVVTAANSPVFSPITSHQIHISRRRRKNERWAAQKPPSQSRGRRTGSGPGKIQRSARRSRQGIYYCTRRAFFCGVFRRRRRRASSSLGRAVTFSTDEERNLTQGTDSRAQEKRRWALCSVCSRRISRRGRLTKWRLHEKAATGIAPLCRVPVLYTGVKRGRLDSNSRRSLHQSPAACHEGQERSCRLGVPNGRDAHRG
jgi:hypothetical protein